MLKQMPMIGLRLMHSACALIPGHVPLDLIIIQFNLPDSMQQNSEFLQELSDQLSIADNSKLLYTVLLNH